METWQAQKFAAAGIDAEFVQDNHSRSSQWTLRGLHLQMRAHPGQAGARDARAAYSTSWSTCAAARPQLRHVVGRRAVGGEPSHAVGAAGTGARHFGDLRVGGFSLQMHGLLQSRSMSGRWPGTIRRCGIEWPLPAGRRAQAVGQGCARRQLRRHREVRVKVLVLGGGGQVGARGGCGGPAAASGGRADAAQNSTSPMQRGRRRARWLKPRPIGSSTPPPTRRWISPKTSREREPAVNDTAVGVAGRGGGADATAGCCICPPTSCSTAHPADAYLPGDPTQSLERLRREQARRRTPRALSGTGRHRAAHRVGVCRRRAGISC